MGIAPLQRSDAPALAPAPAPVPKLERRSRSRSSKKAAPLFLPLLVRFTRLIKCKCYSFALGAAEEK